MNFQEAFFDELEKIAVVGTIAAGAALHGATNAAVKALEHERSGLAGKILNPAHRALHRTKTSFTAEGMKRGLKGKSAMGFGGHLTRTWGLPEVTSGAEAGHTIGANLATLRPSHRYRRLRKLRKSILKSQYVKDAPIGNTAVGAINRVISDTEAMRAPRRKNTITKKDGGTAILAGLAGAPAIPLTAGKMAIHGGINMARVGTAKSKVGKDFASKGFKRGIKGHLPSKGAQAASDYGLSPAAMDPHRLGHAVSQETTANQRRLAHAMTRVLPRTTKNLKNKAKRVTIGQFRNQAIPSTDSDQFKRRVERRMNDKLRAELQSVAPSVKNKWSAQLGLNLDDVQHKVNMQASKEGKAFKYVQQSRRRR
jgi:hypothetical protein